MHTLAICLDSVRMKDIGKGYLKQLADSTTLKGDLKAISLGHTVTSSIALMTGRVPRYGGRPVGDWYYVHDGQKRTHNIDSIGSSIVGKSGLNEIWFNIPLLYPVPRVPRTVVVSGPPWFKLGYYTQPPWLEQQLAEMQYVPDVGDDEVARPEKLIDMVHKRGNALRMVLKEFQWDFALAWFTEPDRLHHMTVQPRSPHDTPENFARLISAVDMEVFQTVKDAKPDNLIVFSDHGWNEQYHSHAPDGFYMVRESTSPAPVAASILDIMPTVYALHGLDYTSAFSGTPLTVAGTVVNRNLGYIDGGVDPLKVRQSHELVKSALGKYSNPAVLWSGGKDSTLVAFFAKHISPDTKLLFIETRAHFRETEIYREVVKGFHGWDSYTIQSAEPMANMAVDRTDCCYRNKVKPLHDAVAELGIDAILTGVKHSDAAGRENEVPERTVTTREGKAYTQVNPILEWTEDEVLIFLEANGIVLNPLYYMGFRSIDCQPCTKPNADMSKPERYGRREKDEIAMVQLRKMGYF
jgi:phosphoadenosine phosphosulfate reductase